MKLAGRVAESVPLEPATAFRLLYSNELQSGELDLGLHSRIRVISPYWREPGAKLMAEGPYTVTGRGYSLTVTGESTENLVGYETTIYAVQPKAGQAGYAIAPLYTDRNTQGKIERRPKPAVDYLQFQEDAAFFQLFYKSWRNDFTALVVGARTPSELERRIGLLQASGASASCDVLNREMCVVLPKDAGLTALIAIMVNGTEVLVNRGVTVFNAIRTAGELQPRAIMPNLRVYKPWNGRLTTVAFDATDDAILRLILKGGESISWH